MDHPLTVYVAGPMSGIAEFNFPAFREASGNLRALGHEVISPHELDEAEGFEPSATGDDQDPNEYAAFLARDIQKIAEAGVEAIVCLPGWEDSGGAKTEVQFGRALGCHILSYPDLLPIPKPREWLTINNSWRAGDSGTELLSPEPPQPGDWGERQTEPPPGGPRSPSELAALEEQYTQVRIDPTFPATVLPPTDAPSGEVRKVDPDTGGAKGQKPERMDLIPMPFLLELAKVYGEGAKKYADFNYLKGYDWKLSQGAMLRHIAAFFTGESIDPETGCHHLGHAAWHCATLFLFERHNLGKDHTLRAVLDGDVELDEDGQVA